MTDKAAANKEGLDRLLTRLLQYGYLRVSSVERLLGALSASSNAKEMVPLFSRLLFYLVQLALGCGSAGTPLPLPANKSACVRPGDQQQRGPACHGLRSHASA